MSKWHILLDSIMYTLAILATLLLLQFLDELVSLVVQMRQKFLKCLI